MTAKYKIRRVLFCSGGGVSMDRFIARTIEKRSIQRGGLPTQWYQAGPSSIVRERHLFDKSHDDKEKSEKSEAEASDNNDNKEKKKKTKKKEDKKEDKKDDKKDDKKSNNDAQGPCWNGFHRDYSKPAYSENSCVSN